MDEKDNEEFTSSEPPSIEPERASIVEKLLESNPLLEKIRFFLLGYYIEDGQLKNNDSFKLINEQGCRAILFEVSQRIAPQVILGTITEDESKERSRRFEIALSQKLVNNFEDWEVKNITSADIIVDTLGDLIFVAMTRPISGTAFGGIIDISQLREQMIQRDIPHNVEEKESLFNRIRGRHKGG